MVSWIFCPLEWLPNMVSAIVSEIFERPLCLFFLRGLKTIDYNRDKAKIQHPLYHKIKHPMKVHLRFEIILQKLNREICVLHYICKFTLN